MVPLFVLLFFWYLQSFAEPVALLLLVILYSGYVGGLPYLILVVPLLFWMRTKSENEIRKALLWSPVSMLIPLALCYAIYQFGFDPAITFFDTLKMYTEGLVILALFTLAFGYAYVGIAFALAWIFGSES